MDTLPFGFRIGHWTDLDAATGCTVVVCPSNTVGGCDVRGSSPGSRELMLLASDKTMQEVHAVVLTGGSAFGLAAADGVMKYLEERSIGYSTPWGRVPIVPAAVIFDLNIGSPTVRPDSAAGYAACVAADGEKVLQGTLGAGTGATLGKWAGSETRMKGGIGFASRESGRLRVSALAVVNPVGDVLDEHGAILAGARTPDGRWVATDDPVRTLAMAKPPLQSNTTLVVIMTNATLTKVETNRLAQRGHDGMARAIIPVHTSFDGDIVFGLSAGTVQSQFDIVAELGAEVTARAIRHGAMQATTLHSVPSQAQ
jgi:L-aminopeptidase/D-esterase-like protein